MWPAVSQEVTIFAVMPTLRHSPLVSVIMAVKDTEPYLPACLDSILDQTFTDWELIAVNDHSTDRTPEILADYAVRDERIRVFQSAGYRLIPALQEGYRHVRGSLLNRMDSDDRMPADKLESMVEVWETHGKGTVVAGGTEHFVDEGEVGGGFRRYEAWLNELARTQTHYQEIYQECVIPSHSWMLHKEDMDRVGAFDPVVYPEDYDLCFRFYQAGLAVVGMDKVLHYWRDRSDRISRTWDEYKDNRYFDLKLRYFFQLDRDPKRPLVLWGAGRNGKDMAKLLLELEPALTWCCDNDRKIGKDVYGLRMSSWQIIPQLKDPQIMIVVSSPDGKREIREQLLAWGKKPVQDFWFFN
ncbi:MAG: glycosyltransferase [Saprospiraceae bacterium]|nr:glycosyltransferase [Saprospiraceae bacterium]